MGAERARPITQFAFFRHVKVHIARTNRWLIAPKGARNDAVIALGSMGSNVALVESNLRTSKGAGDVLVMCPRARPAPRASSEQEVTTHLHRQRSVALLYNQPVNPVELTFSGAVSSRCRRAPSVLVPAIVRRGLLEPHTLLLSRWSLWFVRRCFIKPGNERPLESGYLTFFLDAHTLVPPILHPFSCWGESLSGE